MVIKIEELKKTEFLEKSEAEQNWIILQSLLGKTLYVEKGKEE